VGSLPWPAPEDPLPLVLRWLAEAEARVSKNPWAMALATVSSAGEPSLRYVLLKSLVADQAYIVFYTNYGSRKSADLDANGRAAGTLYWSAVGRQLRFEGRTERSPGAESDQYFASRARLSQLNAWASEQSRPIDSPESMSARLDARTEEFAGRDAIPRPSHWGGYRLHLEAIEFWLEGADRFHERLRYERRTVGGWSSAWLQP
jgi:pyridoxamine 5'-phosphate oxidase